MISTGKGVEKILGRKGEDLGEKRPTGKGVRKEKGREKLSGGERP